MSIEFDGCRPMPDNLLVNNPYFHNGKDAFPVYGDTLFLDPERTQTYPSKHAVLLENKTVVGINSAGVVSEINCL